MLLRLGLSTCPNDTFTFHAVMARRIDLRGLEFAFTLEDVQQLNERLAAGELDISKASFHAALDLSGRGHDGNAPVPLPAPGGAADRAPGVLGDHAGAQAAREGLRRGDPR